MKNHNIISVAIRGLAAVALSLGAASSFGATWGSLDTCADAAAGAWGSCTRDTTFQYTGTTATSSTTAVNQAVATADPNYGMYVGSDGDHGLDNLNGIDGIVFKFTQGVQLTSLTVGWWSGDMDASVYMWTGTGAPSTSTPNSLAYGSTGWSLVSNVIYSNNSTDSYNGQVGAIASTGYSSYWLVSAYVGGNPQQTNDAFKLMALAGNVCDKTLVGNECKTVTTPPGNQVPEPGSLALLGLGAMGMIAARRRQQRQQNLAA